jgi:gamma-glutamyltranspeptidase / glutathione hydrolase
MRIAPLLFLTLVMLEPDFAQQRWHARSVVYSTGGIVATSQTLASAAGAQVLARGGSAADAAIAANIVMTVVEPMSNGIGGDLFAIVRDAGTGQIQGLNASGPAPAGLTIKAVKDAGFDEMPQYSIHSVTVPGCVRGWADLHAKYGKLPWAELFAPAIHYAEQGFPVTELIAAQWGGSATFKKLAADPDSAPLLPGGKPPALGQVHRNPELGAALRLIAKEGPAAFYNGAIAKAILAKSTKLKGTLSAEDLSSFQAEWVQTISTTYRGWTVHEIPPNSQGLAALSMLNLMELHDLGSLDSLSDEALHIQIEAQKLAYADLARYVADPRVSKVPVAGLLSKEYAKRRGALINLKRANCEPVAGEPLPSEGDTIYLSAVDSEGNLVSLIQSIYQGFGSGIAVPGYGFHLHNRGGLFTLDEKHPNALAPNKRPFHTIIPAFMEKGERHIAFGIMGGLNQAQAHAQFVSRVVDHHMNLQQALEAPRFTRQKFTSGCEVHLENRFPAPTVTGLVERGHIIRPVGPFSLDMGGGQAVEFNSATKVKSGGSSPRKDGAAVPEAPNYWKP